MLVPAKFLTQAVSGSSDTGRSGCTQALARPPANSRGSLVGKTCFAFAAAGAVAGPLKATGRLSRRARRSAVARRATDTGSLPDVWKAGPAEIVSGQAQKVLYLLKNNPELFEGAIETELEKLSLDRQKEEEEKQLRESDVKEDQLVLRRRMDEVREAERARVVMELLYLKVCSKFKDLEVPLIPTMKDGGAIRFGGVDLKALTEIYSADALELVKEHLYRIAGEQNVPGPAVIHISLFQAGQVYAISAAFGYYMRRVDARYQLEKLMQGIADDGPTEENLFDEPSSEVKSLKEYIQSFGPMEMQELALIASSEAQMCMEGQISALFGDLGSLKQKLMDALGEVTSNEDATAKLQEAIQRNEIDSIRLSFDQLKRFILEAVAFGALLNDSEKQIDGMYELTPAANRRPLLGDGDFDAGRMLPE